MAVTAPVAEPEPGLPPERRRGRHVRSMVGAVVVVTLLAVVVWWLGNDTALVAQGNGRMATTGHVGSTSYLPLALADAAPEIGPAVHTIAALVIDLRSVEPVIVQNTSDATVVVMVCTAGPIPGAMRDATSDSPLGCSSIAPFSPGKLDLNPGAHRLVLAITPQKPGTLIIDGADVDYRHGIRTGHQRVGDRMRVTANTQ